MTKGLFITFEGTEGCGKSTQVKLLTERLTALGHHVHTLREPGGTPIGEELRHTLKHSQQNHAMTAEAELLLMNASRAQLVREIIRPALDAGEIVVHVMQPAVRAYYNLEELWSLPVAGRRAKPPLPAAA